MQNDAEVLLFDLGRVLIHIDFGAAFAHWGRAFSLDPDALATRFRVDEAFARHERGELRCERFFSHLAENLGMPSDLPEIEAGWQAVLGPAIEGVESRLRRLREHRDIYVLTNTNATHERAWRDDHASLLSHATQIFTSHGLGMRKPEARVYLETAQRIGVPPSRVHFFDDHAGNIEGARNAGMHATCVAAPDDMPHLLDELIARSEHGHQPESGRQ